MKRLYSISLLFLLFCCCEKPQDDLPRITVPENKNTIEVNTSQMLNIYTFVPLEFNFSGDVKVKDFHESYLSTGMERVSFDTILPRYELKVVIDDSYTVSNYGYEHQFIPRPAGIQNGLLNGKIPTDSDQKKMAELVRKYVSTEVQMMKDHVSCYPLLLFNKSAKQALLDLKFIQEAKDIDGKWKPIEFSFEHQMCGTGKGYHAALGPKKYVAYTILKYNGDFKTKIRVKFKNNDQIYYSNEIDGSINRSQFKQEFCKSFIKNYGILDMYNFESYRQSMFLEN